jgi:hypothetical protein
MMTMKIRMAASALFAVACATVAADAAQPETTTVKVAIVRTTGTCPATIPIKVTTTGFDGGVTLDITAQTMGAAYASELLSATPQRIAFAAELRSPYESCEGSGRTKDHLYGFTLHSGKLSFVVIPGVGPNATPPGLLDVSVGGTPHVKMAFTD